MLRVRVTVGVTAILLAALPALAQTDSQAPAPHILGTLPADAAPTAPAPHTLGTLPANAVAAAAPAAGPTDAAAPDENAPPLAFIQDAMRSLAAGRIKEAGNSIEQAESRALTRSVPPSQADKPSQQQLVQQLSSARQALDAGDRLRAVSILEVAAKNPQARAK